MNVHPTSTTIESGVTISLVRSHGAPVATMMISDFRVISVRFLVLLLQLVTVAPAFTSMRVIGFPTILDRQITVTFFHCTSI
jgi:hypothetical protein